uniref:Uncharacterized protein n=1 Tax=Craspedostauros australis TaxID=1486917 RepID=A0A7R9ZI32_9STRA|mmetsp:Transcript_11322/g.31332  ORF Transcript_11322/g.31332 Transcript_11322/m.31332 type:complete len:273 (+) Transcript_11322:174-992(+)
MQMPAGKSVVIATRLHLGKASQPPSESKLKSTLQSFTSLSTKLKEQQQHTNDEDLIVHSVVAVDSATKIEGYDLVQTVKDQISSLSANCHVLPVTPWGKFVPALNALVRYASEDVGVDLIMFVSAEVDASANTIATLCNHVVTKDDDTLVAGAVLNGHEYSKGQCVPLTGRTCPWNTLAVWNVEKLSRTGFQLYSDLGTHAGVEECLAAGLYQRLFPASKIKLVELSDVSWQESFEDDAERKRWHEQKMKSKWERADVQLKALNLDGVVDHV